MHRHPVRFISVGELIWWLALLALVAVGAVQFLNVDASEDDDEHDGEGGAAVGKVAQIPVIAAFALATRSGIVQYLLGVPFERALRVRLPVEDEEEEGGGEGEAERKKETRNKKNRKKKKRERKKEKQKE